MGAHGGGWAAPGAAGAGPQVGYVLRSYPRLSQTFVLGEILALERLGVGIRIFAATNPREPVVQPEVADVRAPVHYFEDARRRGLGALLLEHVRVALAAPRRYAGALWYVWRHRELDAGYRASSRFACFGGAVHLARLLGQQRRRAADGGRGDAGTADRGRGEAIGHLHAHFAHDPALVALLTHRLTGITYSFTAHARDLYQIPVSGLVERVERASAVLTCCGANARYLDEVVPARARGKVRLIYHGVDARRFTPAPRRGPPAAGPLILAVGRLVEKKGFPDLLGACHELQRAGRRFRCEIYGDGPLRDHLLATIERLGLAAAVVLAGERAQRELVAAYQRADVFALTPVVAGDGDRDGIPNVLLEAMACGLPVVSTAVGGIPELVAHDHNGLLAEPHDIAGIAACLAALLDDEARRTRLGEAARRTVEERFDQHASARELAALFAAAGRERSADGRRRTAAGGRRTTDDRGRRDGARAARAAQAAVRGEGR